MCGRFIMSTELVKLKRRFEINDIDFPYTPRYNIAPTQKVMVIHNEGSKTMNLMQWGLIPFWAKDASIGNKLINARAESLIEKPSFKNPFLRRRCLIPANGFYEWKKNGQLKAPVCIMLKNREPFGFAGLWDIWQSPQGVEIQSFTIITTSANELLQPIHDRMPVIISRDKEEFWLDRQIEDANALMSVLTPYRADEMVAFTVSPLVNSPKNDSPDLIWPV